MTVFEQGAVLEERFEILEEVGAGGMGVVYRAHDKTFARDVALKVLREQMVTDAESVQRFKREARTISVLKHPNIMEIYSVFVTRDAAPVPYFAMEFLRGVQMSELLEKNGPIAWRELLPYMIQVCDALQYAHEQEIVHRDIKPSNIMLVEDGHGQRIAKVVDFGIAKSIAASAPKLTKTNMMMGSVPYMSPTDFAGTAPSPASDIYALGCTMTELLSGKPPFMGETVFDTISQHSSARVPTVRDLNATANRDMPPDLQKLLVWMLAKDPQERAPSAVAVRDCLQAILAGKAAPLPKADKDNNPLQGGRGRIAFLALCALLIIGAACMLVPRLLSSDSGKGYLTTDHAREAGFIEKLNQDPKSVHALMDLANYYGNSSPRFPGVAKALLDRALNDAADDKQRSKVLLAIARNDVACGNYTDAISHARESARLDSRLDEVGQKMVLLLAFTPARRFDEQIAVAKSFFQLDETPATSVRDHQSDYKIIYDNTIEACIEKAHYDEALRYCADARKLHLPDYDPAIWEMVVRAYKDHAPKKEDVDRIQSEADSYHRGLVDLRLAWALNAPPGMNNDGRRYTINGLDEMEKGPEDEDGARHLQILDAADRAIDDVDEVTHIETHEYGDEAAAIGYQHRHLQALREKFAKSQLSIPEHLPFQL